jgi:hypothetical protein
MAPLIPVLESGKRAGGAGYRDLIRFFITFPASPVISGAALIPAIRTAKQPATGNSLLNSRNDGVSAMPAPRAAPAAR